ncbi:MAG: BlaI/MecI/CopY family transcriptional regulator [Paludisphaera borealis]|uniref:BlaI/MecI/CopY family transcriptional regulator n=1 Tax=Paludisphaera borealis TaxID=1387353 RepID=UPI0028470B77|nr:BlaI/MecI/CopY family transcriptional regulator [Paludisphaera borealis]MDR3622202.1 BlaI/MecI/CopY family transcriptional regulator [Paludisphaera borealis]
MKLNPMDVTEAELALLSALWDHGPATIRQLVDRVYGQGGASVYATVQKLLERLEQKGCVDRDRSESVHVFTASVDRSELIGRRLRAVADALCGGSLTPLLTHLVEGEGMSQAERKELRTLIDRLDRKKR